VASITNEGRDGGGLLEGIDTLGPTVGKLSPHAATTVAATRAASAEAADPGNRTRTAFKLVVFHLPPASRTNLAIVMGR
jgi:hypothetical protein